MISVVLYGRNDSHGYNLHRRAALSLNCLAEVLTGPQDEILFVDYNTPRTLPTFIEAIGDTLTERCRAKLRVLRLRDDVHARIYGGRTHIHAVEPLARNVAVRRANPGNRWLLSTNTDMVLLPGGDRRSLSDIVSGLADGLYHLPRFELPESFWESLPRSEPAAVFEAIESWAPRLNLDEATQMDDWMRHDAPGDFQLFPRAAILAIDGFNEEMCHGWHVDSNLARRLWMRFGETRSLAGSLRGYHCNHGRVASIYQGVDRAQNDDAKYVFGLTDPHLPQQRESWGLPAEPIEEVDLARVRFAFADDLVAVMDGAQKPAMAVRYSEDEFFWVHTEHVFPHLASGLDPLPRDSRIAYFGFNARLAGWLERYRRRRGFAAAVAVSPIVREIVDEVRFVRDAFDPALLDPSDDVAAFAASADVLVFDFAIDQGLKEEFRRAGFDPDHAAFRPPLPYGELCAAFLAAVAANRDRNASPAPGAPAPADPIARPALVVAVSAFYFPFYQMLEANVAAPFNSLHCRMRQGYVRREPASWFQDKWPGYRADVDRFSTSKGGWARFRTVAWRKRLRATDARLKFRYGWSPLEPNGVWSLGPEAMLSIALGRRPTSDLRVDFEFSRIAEGLNGTIGVGVSMANVDLARWEFSAPQRRRSILGRGIHRSLTIPSAHVDTPVIALRFRLTNLPSPRSEDAYQHRGARGFKLDAVRLQPT